MNNSETIWYVYIVSCADTTLYTGITTDLARRISQHNSRKGGAKYTRFRQPVSLVYFEKAVNRSQASKREYELKKMSSQKKQALVRLSPGQ